MTNNIHCEPLYCNQGKPRALLRYLGIKNSKRQTLAVIV